MTHLPETTYTCDEPWMARRLRPGWAITFGNGEKVFVVAHTDSTVTVVPHRWWMCHFVPCPMLQSKPSEGSFDSDIHPP